LREIVLIEKNKYRQSKSDTAQVVKNRRNTVEKKRYEELEARNNRLKLENSQFQAEMKTMADSIAQLTWELHRYKTATHKDSSNVRTIKK